MDVLLNIIGAVSEDYLQVRLSVVWQNASEKQLTMKAMFDEGWKAVTFGSDQIMMDWCRKRFEEGYWMGNPVRGIGPDSVKFLMGDLKLSSAGRRRAWTCTSPKRVRGSSLCG